MKEKSLIGLLLSLLMLVMVGCGGGGGAVVSTSVSGTAAAGPIVGGTVQIFGINADGTVQTTPLATTPATVTTKAFGNYSAAIGFTGPIMVKVTGGSYKDEATGATVTLSTPLRAAIANATGSVRVMVTPLSEVAVQKTASFTAANINTANTNVPKAVGFSTVNAVATSPSDPQYAFALAVLSQALADSPTDTLATLLQGAGAGIDVTSGVVTDPNVISGLASAKTNAFANPLIDKTGVDGNAVASVTLSASPTTGIANNPVTISADVTKVAGGAAPDGTVVSFTASAGTITASATTTGGVATATLSGITSALSVTVNATAGGVVSVPLVVPFIVQPTQAIVKLATSGTLPAGTTIGAINAVVTNTAGIGLSIVDAGVATSGFGVGSTLIPNTTVANEVTLGLLNAPAGITSIGEFATLTYSIAAGNFPTAADFAIAAGATVLSLQTNTQIPGVTVVVQSVTIQ